MVEGHVRRTAAGFAVVVAAVGKRVKDVRGFRKIRPDLFKAWYLVGVKMAVIAGRFGVSVQACKAMRVKLGLPPRPAHRPPKKRIDPVTLQDACDALRSGQKFGTVYPRLADKARDGDALKHFFVTTDCSGKLPPGITPNALPDGIGDLCKLCGGLMVQTGKCKTCQSCSNSPGDCS